jgi:hypothetical protein
LVIKAIFKRFPYQYSVHVSCFPIWATLPNDHNLTIQGKLFKFWSSWLMFFIPQNKLYTCFKIQKLCVDQRKISLESPYLLNAVHSSGNVYEFLGNKMSWYFRTKKNRFIPKKGPTKPYHKTGYFCISPLIHKWPIFMKLQYKHHTSCTILLHNFVFLIMNHANLVAVQTSEWPWHHQCKVMKFCTDADLLTRQVKFCLVTCLKILYILQILILGTQKWSCILRTF